MSVLEAFGMGVGFFLSLLVLSTVREILGFGTWFGIQVMPDLFNPWIVMIMAPGAFLTLGIMIGAYGIFKGKKSKGV